MKKIYLLFFVSVCALNNVAYAAGLAQTKSGLQQLQTAIHGIVGVVFLITGLIVGTLLWRGTKTWEECSKWVLGVVFAGGAAELISIFFT